MYSKNVHLKYISSKNYLRKEEHKMNLVAKLLIIVANLTSESTSLLGFYEPKMPKRLVRPEKEKQ